MIETTPARGDLECRRGLRRAGRRRRSLVAVPGLAGAFVGLASILFLASGQARACGGLFCDRPPPDPFAPLPVAQNGENIVFAMTPDPAGGAPTLEAHIQIFYKGDAAKFSWVVPVEAAPELGVGTDRLFSALASATTPQFQATYVTDGTCRTLPVGNTGSGGSASASSGGASGSGGSTGAGGAAGGVTVSFQGAVGPFDAAVITSTDSGELKKWLIDNGYTVSDGAAALIDAYVAEQKYFVALKLLNGVGVQSIQPIVLKFRAAEPCVPLRLTAIAANPDMPVLLWVLGENRVVPDGYHEIEIDEARINWEGAGSNYFGSKGLVSQAANEAGGKAFITEYAGTSSIAQRTVYTNGQFDLARLDAAGTPATYVQAFISMGLASDPQALPLLSQYIPMPDAVKQMGVTASQFYNNISSYWQQYAFPPFDLPGLTKAISQKIVQPRIDAQMMIDAHPYLTRLNTYISPEEMDKDPLFLVNRDLPPFSNVHTAVLRTMCGASEYLSCNAPVRLELTDGRRAWIRHGSTAGTCQYPPYDRSHLDLLPSAQRAWARAATGVGQSIIDNSEAIMAGLAANDAAFPDEQRRFDGAGGAGGGGGAGGNPGLPGSGGAAGGGISGGRGGMTGGAAGVAGGTDAGAADGGPPALGGGQSGCGCGVGEAGLASRSSIAFVAIAGAWFVLIARRRRRADRRDAAPRGGEIS